MPKFFKEQSKILEFSQKELFDLVLDIELYNQFLPWCKDSKIISREENILIADLTIAFQIFAETYRSQIILKEPQHIKVEAISGPFDYLHNEWNFNKIDDNRTEIHFKVEFELKNTIINFALEFLFDKAFSRILYAFEQRANDLYGR